MLPTGGRTRDVGRCRSRARRRIHLEDIRPEILIWHGVSLTEMILSPWRAFKGASAMSGLVTTPETVTSSSSAESRRSSPISLRRRTDRSAREPPVKHLGGGAGFWSVTRIYPKIRAAVVVMGNATAFDHDARAQWRASPSIWPRAATRTSRGARPARIDSAALGQSASGRRS
jgi:hypothetical protein